MAIILASKSPRRRELLSLLGLSFSVCTADTDETIDASLPIDTEIARLSRQKAQAVSGMVNEDDIIISADTVVVLGDKVMGKPKDSDEARKMLQALSDNTHNVITAVTVMQGRKMRTETVTTKIVFRRLTDSEIDAYVATKSPLDKAGAYGIQEKAAAFVKEIHGDYFSVVGLPVCKLVEMLREFNINI